MDTCNLKLETGLSASLEVSFCVSKLSGYQVSIYIIPLFHHSRISILFTDARFSLLLCEDKT
jgi:hypothetical protein